MIEKYQNLYQFLSNYFHEEWNHNDSSTNDVLELFIQNNSSESIDKVLVDFDNLRDDNDISDEDKSIFIMNSSFVNFSSIIMTPMNWLSGVIANIRVQYRKTTPPNYEVFVDVTGHQEVETMIQVFRNAKTNEVIDSKYLNNYTMVHSYTDSIGRLILVFRK